MNLNLPLNEVNAVHQLVHIINFCNLNFCSHYSQEKTQ